MVSCDANIDSTGSLEVIITSDSKGLNSEVSPIINHYLILLTYGTNDTKTVNLASGEASKTISNLQPGTWTVSVDGVNALDQVIGSSAEQEVNIQGNQTTPATFNVVEKTGTGTLSIDLNVSGI